MLRLLVLILSLLAGAAASQFPEFSQQYLQRLAGQHDALAQVAAEFDASAAGAGLSRAQALEDLAGSEFRAAHRGDMERVFLRLARIEADLALLRAAGPIERMTLPHRFRDGETLRATWADFQPAVPLTVAGLLAALVGAGAVFGLGAMLAGAGRIARA